MEILTSDPMWKISIDRANQVLLQIWHQESRNLKDREFREKMEWLTTFTLQNEIEGSIVDNTCFHFFIKDETNFWLNEMLMQRYRNSNFKKLAIVVSQDFWSQLSVEGAIDNQNKDLTPFDTQLFSDVEAARQWIYQHQKEKVHKHS